MLALNVVNCWFASFCVLAGISGMPLLATQGCASIGRALSVRFARVSVGIECVAPSCGWCSRLTGAFRPHDRNHVNLKKKTVLGNFAPLHLNLVAYGGRSVIV